MAIVDPAEWEAQQDRSQAIFSALMRARAWCVANPDWNLAVNLNGMNSCVDVKVFKDNMCMKSWLESDIMLYRMLNEATRYMGATPAWYDAFIDEASEIKQAGVTVRSSGVRMQNVVWTNYTYCARCGVAPGQRCMAIRGTGSRQAGERLAAPHYGRQRYAVTGG